MTIGNIIGGAFFGAFAMWMVYGRHKPSVKVRQEDGPAQKV